jgi:hypothetical protein
MHHCSERAFHLWEVIDQLAGLRVELQMKPVNRLNGPAGSTDILFLSFIFQGHRYRAI